MSLIKFCFIASLFLLTDGLPVSGPLAGALLRPSTGKTFPGIVSFGPIFIESLRGGILSEHISFHSCDGCSGKHPDESKPDCTGNVVPEKPPEKNSYVDSRDIPARETSLSSKQIYLMQMLDLLREKDKKKQIETQFEMFRDMLDTMNAEPEVEQPEPEYQQPGKFQYLQLPKPFPPPKDLQRPEPFPSPKELQRPEPFPSPKELQRPEPFPPPKDLQRPEVALQHPRVIILETHAPITEKQKNQSVVILPSQGMIIPIRFPRQKEQASGVMPQPQAAGFKQLELQKPAVPKPVTEMPAHVVKLPTNPKPKGAPGSNSAEIAQSLNKYLEKTRPIKVKVFYPCNHPVDSTTIAKAQEQLMQESESGFEDQVHAVLKEVQSYDEENQEQLLKSAAPSQVRKLGENTGSSQSEDTIRYLQ